MAFTEFAATGNAPRAGLSGAGAHRQQRWQRQKPATEDYDLMNALTLTLIRLAFLAVLWLFVIAAVGVVRTDLFGPSGTSRRQARKAARAPRSRPAQPARPAQPGRPPPRPPPHHA